MNMKYVYAQSSKVIWLIKFKIFKDLHYGIADCWEAIALLQQTLNPKDYDLIALQEYLEIYEEAMKKMWVLFTSGCHFWNEVFGTNWS